jgi:thiol:disulfide interchange protein DsbC
MYRIVFVVGLLSLSVTTSASSQSSTQQRLVALLAAKFPKAQVLNLRKTDALGLWEALVDGQIVYIDARGRFFISGSIYRTDSMENLTDASLAKLRTIPFGELPVQLALTRVNGNGVRKVALFEDPFCGYCRALEQELNSMTDYTAYIFVYPILGDGSIATAAAAWCSEDRLEAWQSSLTLKEPVMPGKECKAPIEDVLALGRRLGIGGTPTILFEDGSRRDGLLKAKEFSALLDQAARKRASETKASIDHVAGLH